MSPKGGEVAEQVVFVVPDVPIKDLLSSIPPHCFKRSALKSSVYLVWDCFVIFCLYEMATISDSYMTPNHLSLSYPFLYPLARFSIWSLYGFFAGLFGMGLWVIAHECGHQAFSESKTLNDAVGWVLHSGLGVPYHSWRITHAKHHASNCHMSQDQVYVPWTRTEMGLPPLDPTKDDVLGLNVSEEVQKEMWEALGDSPIGASFTSAFYLIAGLPFYLVNNTAGQPRYPKFTSHFKPSSIMFAPHQYRQIIISDIGILIWLMLIVAFSQSKGFATVFRVYLVPYIWVNHWLVLITFLQHTSRLIPHYRADTFTFVRGALSTLDRSLLGDLGSVMGWIGAHSTNGISETHVLHHLSSKIPHYNAWEASDALRKCLAQHGITRQGAPGGWAEVYRVLRECKFVEDQGSVLFYKNARGLAAARPVFADIAASDSGIEIDR